MPLLYRLFHQEKGYYDQGLWIPDPFDATVFSLTDSRLLPLHPVLDYVPFHFDNTLFHVSQLAAAVLRRRVAARFPDGVLRPDSIPGVAPPLVEAPDHITSALCDPTVNLLRVYEQPPLRPCRWRYADLSWAFAVAGFDQLPEGETVPRVTCSKCAVHVDMALEGL